MAEEAQPQGDAQASQGLQIFVDEHEMRTLYANMVRIHTTQEEVVLDMVFNMPNPNPRGSGQQQPQMLFKVNDRVIVSYATAKRLAQQITQLVKRYEQQFGEIQMAPGQHAMPPR
jgi:hypothetical protein